MSPESRHDIDALNRLIARLHGAAAGYRKAGADGPGLSDVFEAAAGAHDLTAERLAQEVRSLGGEPASGGSDLSRHAWSELPAAVARGEAATAEAMERAEAELLAEFQTVRDDGEVSGPVRDAVLRVFDVVKAGHDRALQRLDALGA